MRPTLQPVPLTPPQKLSQRAGLGCMRLSTRPDRDAGTDEAARRLLTEVVQGGIGLLDTANVYCHTDADIGHNERLIADVLAAMKADGVETDVWVATKGGLARPRGRWVNKGTRRHLHEACEASLRALSVDCIDLYQLHAPDPRVPLKTSVRALDELRRSGLIARVGLCNITQHQLVESMAITPIDAVQVALSPFDDNAMFEGLVRFCRDNAIALFAHSPLGGPKATRRLAKHAACTSIAERIGCSPQQVALSWLQSLGTHVTPLPGPTRLETARACLELPRASDRHGLDRRAYRALLLDGYTAWRRTGERRAPTHQPLRTLAGRLRAQGEAEGRPTGVGTERPV